MGLAKRDQQHKYVTAWVFAYISIQHYDAYINRFMVYDMTATTFTMLQVLKLQALAWNYKDGGTDPALLTPEQKDKMAILFPNFLEFSSYTFYCNTAALGVFFEFTDYKRFIEKTHEYKNIPSTLRPSLEWLGQSVFFMLIFAVGT